MKITLKLFAILREKAKKDGLVLDVNSQNQTPSVKDALDQLEHAVNINLANFSFLVALNGSYVQLDQKLKEGDVLALIPPVSGGAFAPIVLVEKKELNLKEAVDAVLCEGCGANTVFIGTTRNLQTSSLRKVRYLNYEAYEDMALKKMSEIAVLLHEKHKICKLYAAHRTGKVGPKEASVVVAISAPHRKEAEDAISEFMTLLKKDVPIWKKEVYEDGEAWLGNT